MKTKMKLLASLKIWVVIYPAITLFLVLFGQAIADFPIYIRTLILTASLVPLVVFVGIPIVDFIIKRLTASGK